MGCLEYYTAEKTILGKNQVEKMLFRLITSLLKALIDLHHEQTIFPVINNNRFKLLLYRAKSLWRLCLVFRVLQSGLFLVYYR